MKLFHKGLLFVSGLLTYELILLGTLAYLQHEARLEAKLSDQSKIIVIEGCSAIKLLYDSIAAIAAYGTTRSKESQKLFHHVREALPKHMERMQNLGRIYPTDKDQLARINDETQSTMDILSEASEVMDEPGRIGTTVKLQELALEMRPHMQDLVRYTSDLVRKHRELGLSEEEQRFQQLIEQMLMVAFVSNVALAIAMVFMLSRGLTQKLTILTDNAMRLAKSEPLLPPQKGNDEIAYVDRVFHEMARALQEAAARERAVVEHIPVGFITVNQQSIIMSVNPQAETFTGYSAAEMCGQPLSTFLPAFAGKSAEQAFQSFSDVTLSKKAEMIVRRKDASEFPAEFSSATIDDGFGQRLISSFQDVAERHEIERMRKQFVSIVSHDLKTPLTSIRLSLKMLAEGCFGTFTEQADSIIKSAERESSRLIRLVSELLDVAKLDAGKLELTLDKHNLAVIIERSIESVSHSASLKNVAIERSNLDHSVIVDEDRIVQVMINFLANALKFSPDNSVIKVNGVVQGNMIEVSVIDEGAGIPEELTSRLFQPFERAKGSKIEGTGLGLAICKLIIESHGGRVGAESHHSGTGSRFWLTIKKDETLEAAPMNPEPLSLSAASERASNE